MSGLHSLLPLFVLVQRLRRFLVRRILCSIGREGETSIKSVNATNTYGNHPFIISPFHALLSLLDRFQSKTQDSMALLRIKHSVYIP